MNEAQIQENIKYLLAVVLDCTVEDTTILNEVNYDFSDILDHLRDNHITVNLASVLTGICYLASVDLNRALYEVESSMPEDGLAKFEDLDPFDDLFVQYNALCSEFYLKHRDLYEKYLGNKLSEIENLAGFSFNEG